MATGWGQFFAFPSFPLIILCSLPQGCSLLDLVASSFPATLLDCEPFPWSVKTQQPIVIHNKTTSTIASDVVPAILTN